jgi:hypothetical protein
MTALMSVHRYHPVLRIQKKLPGTAMAMVRVTVAVKVPLLTPRVRGLMAPKEEATLEKATQEKVPKEKAQVGKAKAICSSPTAVDQNHHLLTSTSRECDGNLAKHSENGHSLFDESLPPNKLHQQQFEGSSALPPSQSGRCHLASEMSQW